MILECDGQRLEFRLQAVIIVGLPPKGGTPNQIRVADSLCRRTPGEI